MSQAALRGRGIRFCLSVDRASEQIAALVEPVRPVLALERKYSLIDADILGGIDQVIQNSVPSYDEISFSLFDKGVLCFIHLIERKI